MVQIPSYWSSTWVFKSSGSLTGIFALRQLHLRYAASSYSLLGALPSTILCGPSYTSPGMHASSPLRSSPALLHLDTYYHHHLLWVPVCNRLRQHLSRLPSEFSRLRQSSREGALCRANSFVRCLRTDRPWPPKSVALLALPPMPPWTCRVLPLHLPWHGRKSMGVRERPSTQCQREAYAVEILDVS